MCVFFYIHINTYKFLYIYKYIFISIIYTYVCTYINEFVHCICIKSLNLIWQWWEAGSFRKCAESELNSGDLHFISSESPFCPFFPHLCCPWRSTRAAPWVLNSESVMHRWLSPLVPSTQSLHSVSGQREETGTAHDVTQRQVTGPWHVMPGLGVTTQADAKPGNWPRETFLRLCQSFSSSHHIPGPKCGSRDVGWVNCAHAYWALKSHLSIHSWIRLFIHPFDQRVFSEVLLCAGLWAKCWEHRRDKTDIIPAAGSWHSGEGWQQRRKPINRITVACDKYYKGNKQRDGGELWGQGHYLYKMIRAVLPLWGWYSS